MAERRMFAKSVIDSDSFLDMSLSTQALYFHLAMRADDDGFVNNPKRIQRMIGASDDEMKILIAKQYIFPFESGVVVIKHWKIHNYIQKDRYHPSTCPERALLKANKDKAYEVMDTECIQDCIQDGNIGKVSLGKVSLGKVSLGKGTDTQTDDFQSIQDFYQENIEFLTPFKLQDLQGMYEDFGSEWLQKAMEKVASCEQSKRNNKYLRGVLEGWKKDNALKPWEKKKQNESDDCSFSDGYWVKG
jgi:DnaD/phage-associated family protein